MAESKNSLEIQVVSKRRRCFGQQIDRLPVSANHRWESVPTVDHKAGKTNAPSVLDCGALEAEMKVLKKSSHADMVPQVEVKFNISVQVIVHKVIYGFVLILWLIVSAWPSLCRREKAGLWPRSM